jgi:hypothetical protein
MKATECSGTVARTRIDCSSEEFMATLVHKMIGNSSAAFHGGAFMNP